MDYKTLANGRALPDEVTFIDWMRVYYNDYPTAYKSAEERAISLIVGAVLLPATGIDYEEGETRLDVILAQLWSDITETDYMAGNRTLAMLQEAQELILEYQKLTKV